MRNLVKSNLKYGNEGSNKERNKNEEINLFEPINMRIPSQNTQLTKGMMRNLKF